MRCGPAAICVLALGLATVAEAVHIPSVVLHARPPSGVGSCTEPGLPTCEYGGRPITQIAPGESFRLYILVQNWQNVGYGNGFAGLQTAFTWPADWVVDPDGEPPVTLGCQRNQLTVTEPSDPGGPANGIYATVFDCIQGSGPNLVVIGRIDFLAGQAGCLFQVNPNSVRVELLDCQYASTFIDASDPYEQQRLGSICVGSPGWDSCDNDLHPVEARTWGSIKATYR